MANEVRLIDANAFLKALNEKPTDFLDIGGDFGYFDETIDSVVNEQPTVDAVEVVRCKDCCRCGVYTSGKLYCKHQDGLTDPKPDDFCSYGERKDND